MLKTLGAGPVGMTLMLVSPVVAAALFYVWAEMTTVHLGYQLSRASEMHRKLLEENRGLRIEVAALRAPERLKRIAEDRFHLEPPKTEQVVRIEGDAAIGGGIGAENK